MSALIFKAARKAMKLNQSALALIIGVSRETVSHWERSAPPRVAMLALETVQRTLSSPAKERADESGKV